MWCSHFVVLWILTASSSLASVSGQDQECVDGSYEIDGKTCCLCPAGQRRVSHCNTSPGDRVCGFCENDQFSPHPNSEPNCQRCRSCSHPKEFLEVDTPCTISRDAICRCKPQHFCRTIKEESCLLCHACTECGSDGIKYQCNGRNDTVCKDKTGGSHTGAIVVSVLVPCLVCVSVIVYCLWRRRQGRQQPISSHPESAPHEMEEVPFRLDMDLQKITPELVDILGWSDMKEMATRTSVSQTTIEFCYENNKGNSREQTRELLQYWLEYHGRAAPRILIQTLEKMNKKVKVRRIKELMASPN